ncbi:MAG: TonB-dependent receptor plug domain-containing protein [Bacteroidota bacterium]|nr:TonB-dependent receptor plug domain-containing protein [Bacteroidota bacterium]
MRVLKVLMIWILPFWLLSIAFYRDLDDKRMVRIRSQLAKFNDEYPQERAYLHSDRNAYYSGEDMWFKAYVVAGEDNLPDRLSKNLYVELVNFNNQVAMTEILHLENGLGYGDFHLSDTLQEGNYQLRAYTSWMRNFGEFFFFSKQIKISNPNTRTFLTRENLRENRKANRKLKGNIVSFDLQFFPEGGYLVEGIQSRLAFKAINGLGSGVDVSGKIVDQKGNEVAQFKSRHLGMGSLLFTPQHDKKYYAVVETPEKVKSKFELPVARPRGIVMNVDASFKDYVQVEVTTNRPSSNDEYYNDIILVGQVRNKIYFMTKGNLKEKSLSFKILKKLFPTGIVQLTLFDGRSDPQCERLFFINHQDGMKVEIYPDHPSYQPREKVVLSIKVTDAEGRPLASNLSMSVTDLNKSDVQKANICTGLLLSSDLQGLIEYPVYYFENESAKTQEDLDNLLLTQGWRRFVWKDILADKFPKIKFTKETGISVSGQITRDFFRIPYSGAKVTLTLLNKYNDFFVATTDAKGRFNFENLNYRDTMSVRIEALKPSGRKNLLIYLDEANPPEVKNNIVSESKIGHSKIRRKKEKLIREEDKMPTDGIPRLYSKPSNTLIIKDNEIASYSNIFQYLQGRVPGVNVTGDNVVIRGPNSLYLPQDPLYLIDGIPVDKQMVASMSPLDVERIEILKGPDASIYGSRGANGVIAIYTKRGFAVKRGIDFQMLGYHNAREFYVPKYSSVKDNLKTDFRTTIYWNPNMVTDDQGMAKVSFYNSDATTTFRVIVEGISASGKVGYNSIDYSTR